MNPEEIKIGESVEVLVSGRVVAKMESENRGPVYLVEYGDRRDWFPDGAVIPDE